MREIHTTTKAYKFDELSDQAKEKALENQAQFESENFETEFVYDDAVTVGALLGIEIGTRSGSTRPKPAIYYSGFSCQGDGACFEGRYTYRKGALKAIKSHTGAGRDDASNGDQELLRIAQELQKIQARNFYQLTATMKHSGHYYHSGCMSVDVERADGKEVSAGYAGKRDDEEEITQLMRDFADWIYKQLENEYDYVTGEEACTEAIEINEYEFTEDGEMI